MTFLTGEGADFKLEEINRSIKHWIPAVPHDRDWLQACANYKGLGSLQASTLDAMGITDKNHKRPKSAEPSITAQVLAFRTKIREAGYLVNHARKGPITSLTGEELDDDLIDFIKQARRKRAKYIDCFIKHQGNDKPSQTSVPFKEAPLFVTKSERKAYYAIGNQTTATLKARIVQKIMTITEQGMRKNFQVAFQEEVIAKTPVKQDFLDFYELLDEYLNTLESDSFSLEDVDVDNL